MLPANDDAFRDQLVTSLASAISAAKDALAATTAPREDARAAMPGHGVAEAGGSDGRESERGRRMEAAAGGRARGAGDADLLRAGRGGEAGGAGGGLGGGGGGGEEGGWSGLHEPAHAARFSGAVFACAFTLIALPPT